MFHWQNELFFGRRVDGSVRILKLPAVPSWEQWPKADDEYPEALFDQTIDADSWASIVASVSAGGELFNRFYAAHDFHASTGEVRIVCGGTGKIQANATASAHQPLT